MTSRGLSELLTQWLKSATPDVLHMRSDERGCVLLDVSPEQIQVAFMGTATPVKADARLHAQARFVIDHATPGLRRV